MSEAKTRQVSEEEARQVAEASREKEWQKPRLRIRCLGRQG